MKRQITISLLVILSIVGLSSREECIKCEVMGTAIDSLIMIDTNDVVYDEFCGTPSEADAFIADVQFAAESRSCKVYSIRKIETGEVLISQICCGGISHLESFEAGLDTLLFTTYVDFDAEWVVDTVIMNSASWHCN